MHKYYFVLLILIFSGCKSSMTDVKVDNLDNYSYSSMQKKYNASDKYGEYIISYYNDQSHYFFYYNADDELLNQEIFDYNGDKVWTLENTFNSNKNKVKTTYQFKEDEKTIIARTFKDNKIQELNYSNGNGEIKSYHYYKYFGDSLHTIDEKNTEGELTSHRKFYKKNDQLKSIITEFSDGKIDNIITYEKNDKGDVIKEVQESPSKKTHEVTYYKYNYDHRGHWIKKFQFDQNRDLQFIYFRNNKYNDEEPKVLSENDVAGKWFINGRLKDFIELNSDNTFTLNDQKLDYIIGKWELLPRKSKLILKQNDKDENITFSYYLQGDLIILIDDHHGYEITLERRYPIKYDVNNKNITKESFIKKWKIIGEDNSSFNFLNDGSYEFTYNGKIVDKAVWKLKVDHNELLLEDGKFHGIKFKYVLDDGIISLFDEQGSKYFKLESI